MTVKGKEAHDFEKLRADHEQEWPQSLKDAARRLQCNLDVANSKNFRQSKVMMDGLATDLRAFVAELDKWQSERDRDAT